MTGRAVNDSDAGNFVAGANSNTRFWQIGDINAMIAATRLIARNYTSSTYKQILAIGKAEHPPAPKEKLIDGPKKRLESSFE